MLASFLALGEASLSLASLKFTIWTECSAFAAKDLKILNSKFPGLTVQKFEDPTGAYSLSAAHSRLRTAPAKWIRKDAPSSTRGGRSGALEVAASRPYAALALGIPLLDFTD